MSMNKESQRDLDQQGQDADDYYQDIVVEDAASVPDGCLGIVIMFVLFVVCCFV